MQCPIWLVFFYSSLIACFPGLLLKYCLSALAMVPVVPVVTGINFAVTFHMRWIYFLRSLYFKIFWTSFLITFLSPGIAPSINMHVLCLLSWTMMSGLFLGIFLSVRACWFHNMVTLPSRFVSTDFGTVHGHTSVRCLILPCIFIIIIIIIIIFIIIIIIIVLAVTHLKYSEALPRCPPFFF